MAIQVTSFIVPKNGNTFFVLEDKYIKGGLQVAATIADRDLIPDATRKAGMLVIVQSDLKVWQMGTDLLTWNSFSVGGDSPVRQTVKRAVANLLPTKDVVFSLPLGATVLVLALSVDTPCVVEAFGSSDLTESNPYKFVATSDHLSDDGSSMLSDGSILRGRRYSILANLEPASLTSIYFRVTNSDTVAKTINLTILFLPLE